MATVTESAAAALSTPQAGTSPTAANAQSRETDGFHLVIDALKLNGIDTIFGLPGIPITDLTRKAQAAGMRVISFRHEQNAGNAAAIAGFLTQKPGICLTVSAPGFLNGLTALANATTNCFPMILMSGSSEREVVDLQQGDYEEMDQLAIARPLAKAAFRVLHAEDIGVGVARAIRAAVSGRPGGVYLDLPAKLFPQPMDAEAGRKSLIQVVDPAPRQIPAPDAVQRALALLKAARRPLILLGKGAAYAQADADIRALVESTGIPYLPMSMAKGLLPDTHEQSAAAARSYVLPEADVVMLIGARLNWLLSHGKGKTWGGKSAKEWGGQKFIQVDISPQEADSNVRIDAPVVGDIGSCVSALLAGIGSGWAKPPAEWLDAIAERRNKNVAKMAETLARNPSPMNFHSALSVVRDIVKANPEAMLVNEGANALDFTRSIVDMYRPRKRVDVGTWGVMGMGMGFAVAAAVVERPAGDRDRGRQRLRLLRHGSRDHLPLQPAGVRGDPEQQRRLPRRRGEPDRRARSFAPGVRQGRALREADGGLRRRGRARHDPGRAAHGHGRGPALAPAHAHQCRHRRERRHRERPHHQPEPDRQEKVDAIVRSPSSGRSLERTTCVAAQLLEQPSHWRPENGSIEGRTNSRHDPRAGGAHLLAAARVDGRGRDQVRAARRATPRAASCATCRTPTSLYFTMLNCNKRSITVNMKTAEGKTVFVDLLKNCDIIMENFGPGVLDRLGFTWEKIHEVNPKIVMGSIKGFGSTGPYADFKAYENVAQAMGGAMSTTGDPRRPALRHRRADRRLGHRPAPGASACSPRCTRRSAPARASTSRWR